MAAYDFEPIGFIRSCFREKFGIPRQPGLVPSAEATLVMEPPFCRQEAFRQLESFSHIWVLFVFHQSPRQGWKATVRPPRLGGNQRVGVFATRSGYRPNAIGQSVVRLISVESVAGRIELRLGGADLLDGTPVLDIKPYLPYSDAVAEAEAGYIEDHPRAARSVRFSPQASERCKTIEATRHPGLRQLITELLAQDPRPAYRDDPESHLYGMRLWDVNIRFRVQEGKMLVEAIEDTS